MFRRIARRKSGGTDPARPQDGRLERAQVLVQGGEHAAAAVGAYT
jgi:hypothetical protein